MQPIQSPVRSQNAASPQHYLSSPPPLVSASASASASASSSSRIDHITLARKAFGANVDLSGLGPGNERVVAAELLLLAAAGGANVVLDVTRAHIPLPALPNDRPATQLERAAWSVLTAYRQLWIEAWEFSDEVRVAESKARSRLASLMAAERKSLDRKALVAKSAWRLIEAVELDCRGKVMNEESLTIQGLVSFFRTRRNEIEIARQLIR